MEVAEEGLVPSAEGEEGHGGGDADVDADHAGLDAVAELAGCFAAAGEDGGAVAVDRGVGEIDRGVEVFHADDVEHGTEDFFPHGDHVGKNVVEDGGTDVETFRGGGDFGMASVGQRLGALVGRLRDEIADAVGVLAGNDGAHLGLRVAVGRADADFRDDIDERGKNGVRGVADGDGGGTGHAAFTGAPKGGFDQTGGGVGDVRIGHNEDEIFRPAGGLHAFAVGGAGFEDVFGDGRGSDERNRFDRGVAQDGVNSFASAVHEVEHSVGETSFLRKLRDADRGERDFFARFEDEGVAAGDGHGPHPERDHGGEVEGRDAGDDAEGLADGIAVDAARHVFERLAHKERRGTAGELDVFQSAADVAPRFGEGFAVFAGDALGQLLEMFLEQDLELHEDAGALDGRGFHPGGEGVGGGADGLVDDIGAAERGFGDDLADGRIVDGGGGDAGDVRPFAADEQRAGEEFTHICYFLVVRVVLCPSNVGVDQE